MSEMVDQGAEALLDFDLGLGEWESSSEEQKNAYRKRMISVLYAIREPTPATVGHIRWCHSENGLPSIGVDAAIETWNDVIDEALK